MKIGMIIGMMLCSVCVSAEDFGRLFTNQEERRALDGLKQRQPGTESPVQTVATPIAPVVTNAPDEVRFSGYIRRADGTYAIWVNGASALSNVDSPIETAQFIGDPDVALSTGGQQATMRPGQVWSLNSNTIREGYYLERPFQPELPKIE